MENVNTKIQEIKIDVMDIQIYEHMYSKQYDEGRQVVFHITENGKPFDTTGYKATFQMKKPDGTIVVNDYDIEEGKFTVTLTNQMTVCAGNRIPFQIQLIKVSDNSSEVPVVLTTVTGYLKVTESVVQPDDVISSDEFNALTHTLIRAEQLQIEVTQAEELRQGNEEIRQTNEDTRMAKEKDRQTEEAERQANEALRINGEDTRCRNEETRQSNENIRNSNETTRQNNTAEAITNSVAATTDCINATTDLQQKLNQHHFVLTSDKGINGGVAELDENGLVPSSQLPGYVDDVLEGYLEDGIFYNNPEHTEELAGEAGKIYVDLETNKTYRWSGSSFIVISETIALGETSSTAYRGDRGKTAYEHSQAEHARTDATKVERSVNNGAIRINDDETSVYVHPDSGATTGSYGDASDQSPAAGDTFKVPYVTVDSMGHVTEVSEHTVTLPTTSVTVDDELSTESTNPVENKVVTQAINELVNIIYPVGSIYMSVNSTNPGDLFGGTWAAWGSGRVPVGINESDNDFNASEQMGGEKTHILTTAELSAHSHTFTGTAVNTGNQSANHTHSIPALSGSTGSNGAHNHILAGRTNGFGDNSLINGVVGTNAVWNSEEGQMTRASGNHSHPVTTNESNTGSNSANHTHSVTAKGTINKTGSDSAHNNLQPYIVCYMWKRVA